MSTNPSMESCRGMRHKGKGAYSCDPYVGRTELDGMHC